MRRSVPSIMSATKSLSAVVSTNYYFAFSRGILVEEYLWRAWERECKGAWKRSREKTWRIPGAPGERRTLGSRQPYADRAMRRARRVPAALGGFSISAMRFESAFDRCFVRSQGTLGENGRPTVPLFFVSSNIIKFYTP